MGHLPETTEQEKIRQQKPSRSCPEDSPAQVQTEKLTFESACVKPGCAATQWLSGDKEKVVNEWNTKEDKKREGRNDYLGTAMRYSPPIIAASICWLRGQTKKRRTIATRRGTNQHASSTMMTNGRHSSVHRLDVAPGNGAVVRSGARKELGEVFFHFARSCNTTAKKGNASTHTDNIVARK
jgi:hypothetical protein